jgi:hypothetical protein
VVFGWRALRPPRVVFVIACVSCNKVSHFRQNKIKVKSRFQLLCLLCDEFTEVVQAEVEVLLQGEMVLRQSLFMVSLLFSACVVDSSHVAVMSSGSMMCAMLSLCWSDPNPE